MKRRSFIQLGVAGSAALQLSPLLALDNSKIRYEMPKRKFGKTGEMVSIVGFGGIMLRNNGQEFANRLVSEAFDAGINYFDVAPGYGDAQELLGPALQSYRKKSFLACKTNKRLKDEAEKELHDSLKKLKTDHFDLYQLHAMSKQEDIDQVFGPGGTIELFEKARKDGKVKHLGFSAHNEEVALKAMDLFDFDTILYPFNCVCWHNGNFGPEVFETARRKNMGISALKAVAKMRVPENEKRSYDNMWYLPFEQEKDIENSLRFTLSKDLAATVHAGDVKFFSKTIEFVRSRQEIAAPDENDVKTMIAGIEPIFRHPVG